MGTPKRSYCFKKPWSPASRDPRFSRATPDRLRARFQEQHRPAAFRDVKAWLFDIDHSKARKTPTNNPARAQLVARLKEMVAIVEEKSVGAAKMASPMPSGQAERPETAVCEPPQRSVAGFEACGHVVGSPVPPLGPLA